MNEEKIKLIFKDGKEKFINKPDNEKVFRFTDSFHSGEDLEVSRHTFEVTEDKNIFREV